MAVTTIQTLTQSSTMTEIKEFLVPTILSVNLKKTTEDRLPILETDNSNSHQNGGDVNKSSNESECDESSENKNFPNLSDNENQINLEILDSGEDDEDVIEMAPRSNRKQQHQQHQSSFLLEPFIKPVDQNIEGNKENPVLKALYGGRTSPPGKCQQSWASAGDKASINNCHPFKKTELSQDLSSDDTPAQIPKSLLKKSKKKKEIAASPRGVSPVVSARTSVLKEIQLESVQTEVQSSSTSFSSSQSFVSTKSSDAKSPVQNHQSDSKSLSSGSSSGKKKKSAQLVSKPRIGYINSERLIQLKGIVDSAIKNHKVYSMTGCYSSVRNALKQRGWIEKIDSDFKGRRRQSKLEDIGIYEAAFQFVQKNQTQAAMRYSSQCNSGFVHDDQITYSGQGEAEIINRMLRNITEDLCWLSRPYPYYCWKDIGKYDMVNRLPKAYFSNKVGLCNSLQQIQWFYEPGVCSTQYPRTYNISLKDEYEAFKDDFRITACICTLKWLTTNFTSGGEKIVRSTDGKVDVNIIEFALRRCAEFVKCKEHEDIDMAETPTIWEHQWDHFLTQYYKIINDGHILRDCKEDPPIQVIVTNAQSMLNLVKPHWPQMEIEGINNYWIVKPGGRCCGNGIVIKNNLEQILTIVNPTITRETRYVVQKYIERPLLIYNTKFDIRQWFLVTNVYPLTIWMYKESYLRFCSQPFTLKSTHESVHLCNNAVQRKYKNPRRDRGLPDENMWDCYTFQTYLKAIGHPDAWDKYIYPGMKEGFIGALLASQDTMERRKNCFELYGADFMISDTLTDGPWLIEINSNPAMDSSTSVTARMCPQVLEDIVKVVIDRRDDKNASTGAFEMIFKQNCPPIPPYLGMSLSIKGKKVYRPSSDPRNLNKKSKNNSSDTLADSDSEEESSVEENIVQKRCSGDFMQPIKTLIDTINGGYSPSDIKNEETDRPGSSSAEDTDSAHYDSDSSDDTDSERLIALEGKEMELKKKSDKQDKNKKDEENDKKKEDSTKRKKVDWIRKNIEDVKSFHKIQDKNEKNKNGRKKSKTADKNKNKTVHEELENIFREEIIKMLDTIECKKFMEDIADQNDNLEESEKEINVEKEFNESDLIEATWEPTEMNESITKMICETINAIEEEKECQKEFLESVTVKGEKIDHLLQPVVDNNMSLISISDFTDYEINSDRTMANSIIPNEIMETGDSDFDAKFERELRELEVKQACLKKKFDKSKIESLSITPQGLLLRKKARGVPRWNTTKTSMDYFREWKYKVDETRKTCEDMLAKLRVFKEANSKLKFHDALRKRMEDEAQFIKRLKVYRTTKNFVKMNKNVAGKKVARPQSEEDEFNSDEIIEKESKEEEEPDKSARVVTIFKSQEFKYRYKKSNVDEDNRFALKLQSYELPAASDPPLAINSETGAVRNVSQTLPKIKQRNRPLLPNGSSGHGRKIEMVLEKSIRKKRRKRLKKKDPNPILFRRIDDFFYMAIRQKSESPWRKLK